MVCSICLQRYGHLASDGKCVVFKTMHHRGTATLGNGISSHKHRLANAKQSFDQNPHTLRPRVTVSAARESQRYRASEEAMCGRSPLLCANDIVIVAGIPPQSKGNANLFSQHNTMRSPIIEVSLPGPSAYCTLPLVLSGLFRRLLRRE